jgi:hypothetical protein
VHIPHSSSSPGGDHANRQTIGCNRDCYRSAIVGAGTVGISAIEHSATQEHSVTQVLANRFTPSKADFRLNDPQRLRKILLGQEHIELPLR